jgi:hypothetical protein
MARDVAKGDEAKLQQCVFVFECSVVNCILIFSARAFAKILSQDRQRYGNSSQNTIQVRASNEWQNAVDDALDTGEGIAGASADDDEADEDN